MQRAIPAGFTYIARRTDRDLHPSSGEVVGAERIEFTVENSTNRGDKRLEGHARVADARNDHALHALSTKDVVAESCCTSLTFALTPAIGDKRLGIRDGHDA
jgi:hypothetical protein